MTVLCYRYVARHNQKAEAAGNNQSVIGSCVGNKVSAVTVSGMHSELSLHYTTGRYAGRCGDGRDTAHQFSAQPGHGVTTHSTIVLYRYIHVL